MKIPTFPVKLCDSCTQTAATIFCKVDSIFLCMACDTTLHFATRHERVWICEVCEHAPASVTCKADAASLCITCDHDIHSANPFAQRHERVPIEPFYDSAIKNSAVSALFDVSDDWMVFESVKEHDIIDPFKDFEFVTKNGCDGVVPGDLNEVILPMKNGVMENSYEIDFGQAKISTLNFCTQSISHNSVSSSEVGIVPEGNSISDISFPYGRNASEIESGNQSDRKARVMRYREKRKNRKFEKTIRYASRKAYAETRPRIKGRFVKRTEIGGKDELVNMSSSASFGLVPNYWDRDF